MPSPLVLDARRRLKARHAGPFTATALLLALGASGAIAQKGSPDQGPPAARNGGAAPAVSQPDTPAPTPPAAQSTPEQAPAGPAQSGQAQPETTSPAAGTTPATPQAASAAGGPAAITVAGNVAQGANRTLTGVRVVFPGETPTTVTVDTIVLKNIAQPGDDVTADEVDLEGLTVSSGTTQPSVSRIPHTVLTRVRLPLPTGQRLSTAGAAGSLPPLADWLLALHAESAAMPSAEVATNNAAGRGTTSYTDIKVQDVDAGTIGSFDIAGFKQSGTLPGGKTSSTTSGRLQASGINARPLVAWFDDDAAASTPRTLETIYRSVSIENLKVDSAGSTFTIDAFRGQGLKLGRPEGKPSEFLADLASMDAPGSSGKPTPRFITAMRGLIHSFAFDEAELDGLSVTEAGKPATTVGLLRFEDYAVTRFGLFRIGNLHVTDPDGTDVTVGGLSIRGFDTGSLDGLFDVLAQGRDPETMTVDQYPRPRLTGASVTDMNVVTPEGRVTLGSFTLDIPSWVGFSPTSIKARMENLGVPLDTIKDPEAQAGFAAIGLQSLAIDGALDLDYAAADQSLKVGPLSVTVRNVGRSDYSAELGGVPQSVLEDPTTAQSAIATLTLRSIQSSLVDGGGFARVIDQFAKTAGTTRQGLAGIAAQQAQAAIAGVGLPEAAQTVSNAVQAFVLDPRSLRLSITAAQALPALTLIQASQGDPGALDQIKRGVRIDAVANQ